MTQTQKALIWAFVILIAAFIAKDAGLSDSASFGIIAGLSGAAFGALNHRRDCIRGCK